MVGEFTILKRDPEHHATCCRQEARDDGNYAPTVTVNLPRNIGSE